jgi:hypothetical protein
MKRPPHGGLFILERAKSRTGDSEIAEALRGRAGSEICRPRSGLRPVPVRSGWVGRTQLLDLHREVHDLLVDGEALPHGLDCQPGVGAGQGEDAGVAALPDPPDVEVRDPRLATPLGLGGDGLADLRDDWVNSGASPRR